HLHEREQEFNVLRGRFKAEWIDAIVAGFRADFEIGACQQAGKLLVTSAHIKDESAWIVFFERQRQKIVEERFAAAGAPGNKGVGDIIAGVASAVLDAL